jgi:hypothetical protein
MAEGAFTALGSPHHTPSAPAAAAAGTSAEVEAWDTGGVADMQTEQKIGE